MGITTDTKNALGTVDNTKRVVFKRVNEKVQLQEFTTTISFETYGEAWIVGSSTNGIVGANTSTQSGLQQVVGGSGRVSSVNKIFNINNVFVERFRDAEFSGGGDASWNTATGTLSFTGGQAYTSSEIYKDTANVTVATFNLSSTNNSAFTASLKSGGDWETVTIGTQHSFTTAGTSLFWKLEAGTSVTVTEVKINYD